MFGVSIEDNRLHKLCCIFKTTCVLIYQLLAGKPLVNDHWSGGHLKVAHGHKAWIGRNLWVTCIGVGIQVIMFNIQLLK